MHEGAGWPALYWWQRLINLGSSRIRVNSSATEVPSFEAFDENQNHLPCQLSFDLQAEADVPLALQQQQQQNEVKKSDKSRLMKFIYNIIWTSQTPTHAFFQVSI